ncbi:MAG: Xaa-Pro peptidase family protein, partial [Dictyoglomaceae bacterium]|nr:Xaa-Pro peptidase family protein [Dictyoglomaceae bacterium]
NLKNIRYLTGFSGSTAILLVEPEKSYILVDSRYLEQVKDEVLNSEPILVDREKTYFDIIKEKKEKRNWKRIGFEGNYISYNDWLRWKDIFNDCDFVSLNGWVEDLRMIKDEIEIENIKKALDIAERALEKTLELVKPKIKEKDIAIELEYQMVKLGAEKPAFDTIVASGWRSALPHGRASNKEILPQEFIVIDFGAFYNGYNSDITRTIFLGNPSEEELLIYNTVFEAQSKAEELIKEGINGEFVDKSARDIIHENGFGEYFGHGLGHGLGLEVHEKPRLAPKVEGMLKENMVITIEPGIYIPKKFGVRIEDIVVVRKDMGEILNSFPKELIIL